MPANQSPLGALPSRFRRPRLLIVGCGDVGMRVLRALQTGGGRRQRVLALTSDSGRRAELRAFGAVPLIGNLDRGATLRRLAGLATQVLHLAPPPQVGPHDPRTRRLAAVLRQRTPPRALVYASTSGVYGDCAGAWVRETRPPAPATARAQRRVDAEASVRRLGAAGVRASVLRVPGIYALDRVGGTPADRLRQGTPVLRAEDDVFTNHIHADDLARACLLALWRGAAQRCYHVSDQTELRMGDYFDLAAELLGLPRPPRLSRSAAAAQLGALPMSFLSESRRLDATRMQCELGLRLRYPTVREGLQAKK